MADVGAAKRVAEVFDRFQKLAATKGILETQLAKEQGELDTLGAEIDGLLASIGYQNVPGGLTPEEYIATTLEGIEAELAEHEKALGV